mmetsp:Transcript_85657/g.250788  ORF Transcript_85657/g.250788 Transcript_85657/m.250788 type:complete len:467 (+) Transcript_85657:73-1473(+)
MPPGADDVLAHVNYRNRTDKPQSERDPDTNKHVMGVAVKMMNARNQSDKNLHEHGFELRGQSTGMKRKDYFNDDLVKAKYYPKCEQVIKQATNAAAVTCFHHAVRGHASGKPFAGIAHADYSVYTGQSLITSVGWGDADFRTPFKGRICVLNLWRNINEANPIQNHHLAMCDGSTVVAPDDFVDYTVIDDASGKPAHTYNLAPNNSRMHRWYYYPDMAADEVLIFMQYDSDPRHRCRYTFHSSVSVQDSTLEYKRESIEVRCVAFFPDEDNNTLPDLTLPSDLRVPAACSSIKSMAPYALKDKDGLTFAAQMVRSDNIGKWVSELCRGQRKVQHKPEFKDLSDRDIEAVARTLTSDRDWTAGIKAAIDELCPYHGKAEERVSLAADTLISDLHHLQKWDAKGKSWVKKCVASNKIGEIVTGLCTHKKKEGAFPFADLTKSEVHDVVSTCLQRGLGDRLKQKVARLE